MRVVIVGSGGREHALAWACAQSENASEVFCLPGNGGTESVFNNRVKIRNIYVKTDDHKEITNFVKYNSIDLVIIGPENPLVDGLSDSLRNIGIAVFGPNADGARIEGSKVLSKNLMNLANIPTAEYEVFRDFKSASKYIESLKHQVVVKASGLAAGKGAVVCDSKEHACAAAKMFLQDRVLGEAGAEIVVEKVFVGKEMSLLALVDGNDWFLLPPSRDHKRLKDNDFGPNTGGMGAYAPLPDLSDDRITEIAHGVYDPIVKALSEVNCTPYRGCLYAGIMVSDDEFIVLEFNCRFGDPETQVVLPLIKIDTLEMLHSVSIGGLSAWMDKYNLKPTEWRKAIKNVAGVTIIASSQGYPNPDYIKGIPINNIPQNHEDLIVYHAGTKIENGKLITAGGRVLAVTGIGVDLYNARQIAYNAMEHLSFKGMHFRRDIALGIK